MYCFYFVFLEYVALLDDVVQIRLHELKHQVQILETILSRILQKQIFFLVISKFIYNELSQKNRFQSVPIAALYLYNIQSKTWFLKNLSVLDLVSMDSNTSYKSYRPNHQEQMQIFFLVIFNNPYP